jgi:hypothetical protein
MNSRAEHHITAACVEAFCVLAGISLLALALLADRTWLDQHVLPRLFVARGHQVVAWLIVRSLVALLGLVFCIWIRRWVGRRVRQGNGKDLAIQCALSLLAVILSGLVSEYLLRKLSWHGIAPWTIGEEPLRQADVHLGWRNAPSRNGGEIHGKQQIVYQLDDDGYRVAAAGGSVDHDLPTILLAGESIMFGYRLNWANSIAGHLESITGTQVANLAVNGYSTGQMYLQLETELPRFRQPVAVVALFTPALLERNLLTDRPYVDAALQRQPSRRQWELKRVVIGKIAPIHRRSEIENDIATTRAALCAISAGARAAHAEPVILVPGFRPEEPIEKDLRQRVLSGLPQIVVPLDPEWRIANDGHPDARADLVMAQAIADELRRRRADQTLAAPHDGC